ncbi:MAG: hypothetical protein OXD46_01675 [Chloroflexi bacterium]|nr:hypothetical protein [Chloroflexota bacterium]
MNRPNVVAYGVTALIAAVLVLGALIMFWVVGFNTDLDFSVETVEEYARWCGKVGDPVGDELKRLGGWTGWGDLAEALEIPVREAEAINPVPEGLEGFHAAKLGYLRGMLSLTRSKHPSLYVDSIELRKESETIDSLTARVDAETQNLSPSVADALRATECIE